MINKQVVKQFLQQETNDYRWIKDVSKHDLKKEIEHTVPKRFKFKTKPYKHQYASFIIGTYEPKFLYLLDMGTGKSKVALDLITYYKVKGKIKKTLVLVPSPISIYNFMDEIKTHSDLTCVDLYGMTQERWNKLESENVDLYVLNYTGLYHMITDSSNDGRVPSQKKIDKFAKHFDSLIMDESHFLKNKNSLNYRLCLAISENYKVIYALTGTPMGNNPMDLWSQFHVVDRGETLGKNITLFRESFFRAKTNHWGGWEYTFDTSKERLLNKKMANKSLRYEESEVKELPQRMYQTIHIRLTQEAKGYYNNIVKGLIAVKGNYTQIEGIYSKLRQICSGYLNHKLDDYEDKIAIEFNYNPKIEALLDLLRSVPLTSKVIIFHEYIHTGSMIAKVLKKEGYKFLRLYGKTKKKERRELKDKFNNDSKIKILLANSKSGGVSLNLQVANYAIYFESPDSVITRKQSEKRIHRSGQKKRTFFYDLIVKSSVEEKILDNLKDGKDVFRKIVEGKIKLGRL